jgi:hypothetical protein
LFGLGEEEEVEEVHMSQNVVTTKSASKTNSPYTTSPSDPPKTTSHTQKNTDKSPKKNTTQVPQSKLEYDFLKDIKRTKENISMFELMKLPQIHENFIKTLQGNASWGTKDVNWGTKKGKNKTGPSMDNNLPKRQSTVNASLTGQRSRSTTPFLITFEIFNRNVHNCMVDSGASSNVIPFKVCEKLNVKPEESDIQII